jgi:hypothetical protein
LWPASATAASALSLVDSESPAAWLALDLIAASGGVPVAREREALVAGFPSFESAILAARRLQWAIQGFSEAGETQAASLAILVHSPEDAPNEATGGDLLIPGEQATPGEILLTEKASQFFEDLPGFAMMAAPGDGLRELLWRGPEDQATRSSDEEVLSRLVELHGAQSPPPEEPEQPAASNPDVSLAEDARTRNLEQIRSQSSRGRSRWVIGGAAAAALVLAAGAFFYWSHETSAPAAEQTPAQTQTPVQTQTPAQTTSPPAAATNAPAAQGGPPASASPAQPAKLTRAEALAATKAAKNAAKNSPKPSEQQAAATPQPERPQPAKAQPEAPKGRCELESSQVNGTVDLAWKNLGRGKYADAKREFAAALACDPSNGHAKDGLERARMAASEADGQPVN